MKPSLFSHLGLCCPCIGYASYSIRSDNYFKLCYWSVRWLVIGSIRYQLGMRYIPRLEAIRVSHLDSGLSMEDIEHSYGGCLDESRGRFTLGLYY